MPMVEFRRDHQPMQPLEAPPHVGVEKQPEDDLSRRKRSCQFEGEARSDEEHEGRSENGPVERVGSKAAGPIQVLG